MSKKRTISEIKKDLKLAEKIAKKMTVKGRFHALIYENESEKKGLKGFITRKLFSVQDADWTHLQKVIDYYRKNNLSPDNPARKNEVKLKYNLMYYNTNTQKVKLCIPLNGCKALRVNYFIDGKKVNEDIFYQEWQNRGYALPKVYKSKSGRDYRSFEVNKIKQFR